MKSGKYYCRTWFSSLFFFLSLFVKPPLSFLFHPIFSSEPLPPTSPFILFSPLISSFTPTYFSPLFFPNSHTPTHTHTHLSFHLLSHLSPSFFLPLRVSSGAQIKIAGNEGENQDRLVTITGTPEAVGMAQYLINSRYDQ